MINQNNKSLMYHYVREDSIDYPFSKHKNINSFIRECRLLKQNFQFYNVSEFYKLKNQKNSILLTFDDGLKDHLNVAEMLFDQNIKATFYIPVSPYLKKDILPVHKTHIICSKVGGESINLLNKAINNLKINKNLLIDYENKDLFNNAYKNQSDEELIKEFKKLINYYGKFEFIDPLLNEIISILDIKLSFDEFYLTPKEIKYIHSLGFEIGSHGVSHKLLSRLNIQDQEYELKESKSYLEKVLMAEVKSFCYPYGGKFSYSKETISLLKKYNYENAISVEYRDINQDDITHNYFEIPRYDCNQIEELFPFIKQ